MGVGQDDEVDRLGIETEIPGILFLDFTPALKKSAIDEQPKTIGLEKMTRTRHLSGCAVARQANHR